jgi:hypothetical protein
MPCKLGTADMNGIWSLRAAPGGDGVLAPDAMQA